MINSYNISTKKLNNYVLMLILTLTSLISSFSFSQNIVVETLNTTGDPFPYTNMCPNTGRSLGVKIKNSGVSTISNKNITITVVVTAPDNSTQNFSQTFNNITLAGNVGIFKTFTATLDMHLQGVYDFAMVATYGGDTPPGGDGYDVHEQVFVAGNIIDLTSLAATTSQSVCKNSNLVNITYDVSYNATDATASGLPAGVSYSFTFPTLTISGAPTNTVGSPFTYSVTATGTCPASDDSTLTGTMTVKSLPVLAYVGNDSICEGFASSVSPTSGGTWVSSSPAVATITNGGAVSGLIGGNSQFTFTNTLTGCHDTLTKFTVIPVPIVAAITGTLTVCRFYNPIGRCNCWRNLDECNTWSCNSKCIYRFGYWCICWNESN